MVESRINWAGPINIDIVNIRLFHVLDRYIQKIKNIYV
jgi:hypothetical protein